MGGYSNIYYRELTVRKLKLFYSECLHEYYLPIGPVGTTIFTPQTLNFTSYSADGFRIHNTEYHIVVV